ncbi:MAG: hypothetical protein AAGC64_10240 [Bacteroidota bacterium]
MWRFNEVMTNCISESFRKEEIKVASTIPSKSQKSQFVQNRTWRVAIPAGILQTVVIFFTVSGWKLSVLKQADNVLVV